MERTAQPTALNLFFPQWQGAGIFALHTGARQLHEAIQPNMAPFVSIPVSSIYTLTTQENILGYSQIKAQLMAARRILERDRPDRIFTLGGDCGVELAPVSYLNDLYDSSLAVVWLDAHGDLNTPGTSTSAHFHGMPLRSLLGEGDSALIAYTFSILTPHQIFLVGTRELDVPEGQFIQQQPLSVTSVKTINQNGTGELISRIKSAGFAKLYVHLDLDVVDPKQFSSVACPTPNGIYIDNLCRLIVELRENFEIVGSSLLECLPLNGEESLSLITPLIDNLVF